MSEFNKPSPTPSKPSVNLDEIKRTAAGELSLKELELLFAEKKNDEAKKVKYLENRMESINGILSEFRAEPITRKELEKLQSFVNYASKQQNVSE